MNCIHIFTHHFLSIYSYFFIVHFPELTKPFRFGT